jgi:hypothetical protein
MSHGSSAVFPLSTDTFSSLVAVGIEIVTFRYRYCIVAANKCGIGCLNDSND